VCTRKSGVIILSSFSVVIPLFNKSKYIVECLESIRRQLYRNYEVVIVDDGSTDGGQEIAAQWIHSLSELERENYRIVSQKNSGVSVARNTGVSYSKYDYIALLDADDYWEDDHLSQLKYLIDKFAREVDVFSSGIKQMQDGVFIYPNLGKYTDFDGVVNYFDVSLISNGFIHSSSVCAKKSVLLDNPFPVGMKNFEDVITWANITCSKGFAFGAKRTAVAVVDAAEASLNIDFTNYLRHERLMLDMPMKKINLIVYEMKFLLIHIMFAKLNMNSSAYFRSAREVFGRSYMVSFCLLVGLFVPRWALKGLKNSRKKNSDAL